MMQQASAYIDKEIAELKKNYQALRTQIVAVALTAQIVKVDMSLIKLDEKGLTVAGLQRGTWRWAKEGSWLSKLIATKSGAEKREKDKRVQNYLKGDLLSDVEAFKSGISEHKKSLERLDGTTGKVRDRVAALERDSARRPTTTGQHVRGSRVNVEQLKDLRQVGTELTALHSRIDRLITALG